MSATNETKPASSPAKATAAGSPQIELIPSLDLPKYLGVWYEVARYDNPFQAKGSTNVKAEYSLIDNGPTVKVHNSCVLSNGTYKEAIGTARPQPKSGPAALEVAFAPSILRFLPLVWGDYWIVDLDDAYTMSAVTDRNNKYMWILSRAITPNEEQLAALMARLEAKGYDNSRFTRTVQKW